MEAEPGSPDEAPRPAPALRPAVLIAVLVGGCAGGLARELVVARWPAAAGTFPWAVLAVNLSGSFLLAALLTDLARLTPGAPYVRPLLASGFCGAFTTFSAVTGSSALLLAHGHPWLGAGYLAASFPGGLLAAAAGLATVQAASSRWGSAAAPARPCG